jgi:hypothetical protein
VFAHGGGVQSTAVLVLSAQGRVDFPHHVFCNVGDDSENPDTLRYVHEVSQPFAEQHGVQWTELRRLRKDGTFESLYESMTKPGSRQMNIPVRTGPGGPPGVRVCTGHWKMDPLQRWLREHGATPDDPAAVGLGFSADELRRVSSNGRPLERLEFPLIELNLTRADCLRIVADAGLPPPSKSACYFCPLRRPAHWAEMRRDHPDLFEKAAALEDRINAGRPDRPQVYLTRYGRPLREAVTEQQDTLFDMAGLGGEPGAPDDDRCDDGRCFV